MSLTPVTYLRRRGPVSQEDPVEAPAGLMVDFDICLSTDRDDSHSEIGSDLITRYAAQIGETPCVFERRRWMPAPGYCAEGDEDTIIGVAP